MFWADKIAKKIVECGKHQPYWVDDMKTPSGRIHVGSLRGVIIHDLIYKSLLDLSAKAIFSYVIDDHDPMDSLPFYLPKEKYLSHLGKPLYTIPSPDPNFKNYAQYFAQEFIKVFNLLGAEPKIIWMSKVYKQGKMNNVIKKVLDNAVVIRQIYEKMYQRPQPKNWYPFQIICPKCGKISTTKINAWDGKLASFQCLSDLVRWTKGCGYQGKISPFNGNGKIPWKVEWACKWQVIGITVEGAGKDHMSKGGSHDIASAVCQKVLNYAIPYSFFHEFFLTAGRKMSSSKGTGSSADEISQIMPPELLRFLMARVNYRQAIDFNAQGNTIPDLFDEYDRCAYEWFKHGRKSDFGRIFEVSQVAKIPKKSVFLPRFREVANYLQLPSVDIYEKFAEIKAEKLTKTEKAILDERIKYAKIWLEKYAPPQLVYQIKRELPEEIKNLSQQQKIFLRKAILLMAEKSWQPEEFQFCLYELAKKLKIPSKIAFQAIYLALIGKTHGPKAAWLILSLDKKFIKKRFKNASQK